MRKIARRHIESLLREDLLQPHITAVVGARSVGKTTLLNTLLPIEKTCSFNCDSSETRDRILGRESYLLEQLEGLAKGPLHTLQEPLFLFIDEAQKLPEAFEIVKQLYDQYPDKIKIILSGSSTLLIKKKSAETLAGRIRYYQLHPFTLEEANLFFDKKSAFEVMAWFLPLIQGEWTPAFGEEVALQKRYLRPLAEDSLGTYLLWGLLPPRLHLEKLAAWALFLRDYIDTYIDKDMRATERIGRLDEYKKVVRLMGNQIGGLVNYSTLASLVGIHRETVREYLSILDESLLGFRLPAFSLSTKRRVTKAEKSFLLDNGLAYYFMDVRQPEILERTGQVGHLYENLWIAEVKKYASLLSTPVHLSYWRLTGQNPPEVDLVIEHRGLTIPVEIKRKAKLTKQDLKGIYHFIEAYQEKSGMNILYGVVLYQGPYQYLKEGPIYLIPDWFWL